MLGEENVKLQSASGICNFCPKVVNTNCMNFKEGAWFQSPDSNFIV